MGKQLTDKQTLFCEEYLIDFNGSRAYRAAYPNVKKDSSAASSAYKLLRKAEIQAYLGNRTSKVAARLEITLERTLRAYARRAYFDPRSLLDQDGNIKPLHRMDRDTAAAITDIKVKALKPIITEDEKTGKEVIFEQSLIEVKFDNGNAARDALAKYLGLFESDNHQKQNNVDIYSQVRAEIELEMIEEVFDLIDEENMERDPDIPDLT